MTQRSAAADRHDELRTVVDEPALGWPLRVLLAIAATAGLAVLVWARPELPPNPWAAVRPEPRDLVEGIVVLAVWLTLIYVLMRIGWLAARPPRTEKVGEVSRPAWARRAPVSRRAAPQPGSTSDPLLELFARPPRRVEDRIPEAHLQASAPATADRDSARELAPPRAMVRVLGTVALVVEGKQHALSPNAQAILAYMAVKRRQVGGEEIAQALWPDDDLARGRQRVWRAMRPSAAPFAEVVTGERGGYELQPDVLDIDVIEELSLDDVEQVERALSMFKHEPFAGLDFAWLTAERARIELFRTELVERLAELEVEQRPSRGLTLAHQLIEVDRLNERAWRLAMRASAKLGNRQAVLKLYDDLRALLETELGLPPQRETRSLYHELLGSDAEVEA